MTRPIATLVVTLSGAIAVFSAGTARAQNDPRKTQAEALFQEGLKLHDKDREAEALERFQKSYAAYPSPSTLVSIGREEQLLGRALAALRHYRQALKHPLLHPRYAQLARQYVAELEVGFGKVNVTGPSGTTLSIDGEALRLPLDEPLDVEAGVLVVLGDHDGNKLEGSAVAVVGKVVVLDLKKQRATSQVGTATAAAKPAVEASSEGGPREATPPEPAPPSMWTTGKTVGVVLGALSIASLGGFVGLRVAAGAKGDDVEEAAKDPSAAGGCKGVSSPACDRVNSSAAAERDLTNASTVSLVGGLALGAAAATFFLWPRSHSQAAAVMVAPHVGATSSAIVVSGFF